MRVFKPFGVLSWFFPIVFLVSAIIVGFIDYFLWRILTPTTSIEIALLVLLIVLISIILFLFFVVVLVAIFFPYVLKSAIGNFFRDLRFQVHGAKKQDLS
jgi:phosphoglycerol transferase MdoB-like AlkP superfamily enzyme